MKIFELFKILHFHDSVVDEIRYLPNEKKLILKIDLCNYDQESYQEGEPEIVAGQLIFSDVEDFKADPPLNTLDWNNSSGNIPSSGHVPERDKDGLEAAEFIISWFNYLTRVHTDLILSVLANEVEWRPT